MTDSTILCAICIRSMSSTVWSRPVFWTLSPPEITAGEYRSGFDCRRTGAIAASYLNIAMVADSTVGDHSFGLVTSAKLTENGKASLEKAG